MTYFTGPDELRNYRGQANDDAETQDLKERIRKAMERRDPAYLNYDEFDQILEWKLKGQRGRTERLRQGNTEDIIQVVTSVALNIEHDDNDYELELRVNLLRSLRGVEVPVASAVLALVYPNMYAVIDFRVWRQLFQEEKRDFNIRDYKRYIQRIRELAEQLRWPCQEVDYAIWTYDYMNNGNVGGI